MSASCHRQAGRIANFVLRCHEAKIALYTRRWEGTKPVARSQAVKPTPLNGVLDSVLSRPRTALITCLLFLAGLFIADLATPKSVLLDALYVIPAAAAVVALRSAWATGVWLVALSLQVISEAKESADLPTMAVEACGLTAVCLVVLFVRRASGDWGRVGVQEDRSRVARELHDGVIQSLAAAQMLLELDADSIPEPARRSVSRAAESIREAIQDMYSYIFELEPNGLLPAASSGRSPVSSMSTARTRACGSLSTSTMSRWAGSTVTVWTCCKSRERRWPTLRAMLKHAMRVSISACAMETSASTSATMALDSIPRRRKGWASEI